MPQAKEEQGEKDKKEDEAAPLPEKVSSDTYDHWPLCLLASGASPTLPVAHLT